MKKHRRLIFFLVSVILVAGCNNLDFKKTKDGMPYILFPGKGKKKAANGSVLKLSVVQMINDSIVIDTRGKMPRPFQLSDMNVRPYDPSELFLSLHEGDSLIAVQMLDTFIKHNSAYMPRFKNGDRLITRLKVLDIFPDYASYQADEAKETEKLAEREIAEIGDYLSKKGIRAEKLPQGVFVETIEAGQGPAIDSGKVVSLKYTGKTFEGKTFDSNIDTAFHRDPVYKVAIGSGATIPGFEIGVKALRQGTHARIYIPSMLGYGSSVEPGSLIKPFDNLIFEIYVTDVKDQAPQPPSQAKNDTTQIKK